MCLDDSDFNKNAALYFKRIGYKCCYLSDVPEQFYFACDNILFLSNKCRITALSDFCEQIDKNCTLSMNLRFKNASNQLNEASEELDPTEYMKLLRATRKTIQSALGQEAYRRYINLINDSGMDSERYINEILQNADDCFYEKGVNPNFKLVISDDRTKIFTQYNEVGFTKSNVRAITSIGESTKKQIIDSDGRRPEIGEKGVGFKSVFAVSNNVFIHSGPFRFKLTDKAPTIPALPPDEKEPFKGTKMIFELKQPIKKDFFTFEKVLRLCLCLRKLRRLKLDGFDIRITDDGGTRRIKVNDKVYEYRIVTHEFEITDNDIISERENQQRKIDKKQKIVCYIPKVKDTNNCFLYSGLPTQVKLKVPLIIDAPFELTTSRDHLISNRWNDYIKKETYTAIQKVIEFASRTDGIDALRFLHIKYEGNTYSVDIFSEESLNRIDLLSKLRNMNILPTYSTDCFVKPSDAKVVRVPDVLIYCLDKNQDIGRSLSVIVKAKEDEYTPALNALGVKVLDAHNTICCLNNVYEFNMLDPNFRNLLYDYLYICAEKDELEDEYDLLEDLEIIPVYGDERGTIQYLSWYECGDNLYIKPNCTISSHNCYILAVDLLSKSKCERIYSEDINELTVQLELSNYQAMLVERINTMDCDLLYDYLMNEFNNNKQLLIKCKDTLIANRETIPLKNELGIMKRGKVYVSNEPEGYFFGFVLPSHIASRECLDFARFIGCKNITHVYFDDLDIEWPLNEEDIESLQDTCMENSFEILEKCKRLGFIDAKLISEYSLGGLNSTTISYDEDVLNQPILNASKFRQHMQNVLRNRIRIEKRIVERQIPYGVPENGDKEFLINNQDVRAIALNRYKPAPGYSVCQMCREAKDVKYMEVNNIQVEPEYYWEECGVSLCLICSKHFEELRRNNAIREHFYREIMDADCSSATPIEVHIGNDTLIFGQTHIGEIQEILKETKE